MSRLTLENFTGSEPKTQPAAPEPEDLQEVKLAAYEDGYKAGWDDAVAAEAENRERVGADFAKTLQEIAFAYHEARAHVLSALGPLLSAMVERVVPHIAEAGFARTVVETALPMAETAADHPLTLRVCPENRDALEAVIGSDPGFPLTIVEDDTLGPGQALIASDTRECEVDIDGMQAAIRTALEEFLTIEEETRRHG